MGLKGKTPAEAAGIRVEGENPWVTVIQNAAKSKILTGDNETVPKGTYPAWTSLHKLHQGIDLYKTKHIERVMRATPSFGLTTRTGNLDLALLLGSHPYTRRHSGGVR